MFADWTDPHDIDHYYDDVGKIFSKVAAYADPAKPIVAPVAPVPSVPVVATDATPTAVPTVPTVATAAKSEFEVVPNSIFLDGHSVGSQPPYNILRSGGISVGSRDFSEVLPPSKDTYINRHAELTGGQDAYAQVYTPSTFARCDFWSIILWFIIGIMLVQVIKLNIMVCTNQAMLQALMQNLGKKL
jgi:hypothetical protein